MVVILDEAANICRIADLPELYSHLGSRGMVPVTILQSYQQGVAVWGEPGMAALWGASTKKVIGAGIDDPRHARDLATLVGQHDVPVVSVSYGDGRTGQQVSLRRQEILEPADIRALPPGTALLLATGARPALISLRPWYTGPDAPRIDAAIARAAAEMRARRAQAGETPAGHRIMTSQPDDGRRRRRQPVYGSVQEWVTSHFLPMFRRPLGGEFRWCAQWWQHAEAITRLTALWHSWEAHAAPARHRHGHLAARSPRPPAARPARPDRPVQHVLRRRAHRPQAGPHPAGAGRLVGLKGR